MTAQYYATHKNAKDSRLREFWQFSMCALFLRPCLKWFLAVGACSFPAPTRPHLALRPGRQRARLW